MRDFLKFSWILFGIGNFARTTRGNRSRSSTERRINHEDQPEGRHNSTHCLYKYYFQILHDQLTSLSSFLRHYKIMSSGRGWVMTPEEKAAALAEAKARGLPDGWRVELDVRPISFYLGLSTLCFNALLQLKRIN